MASVDYLLSQADPAEVASATRSVVEELPWTAVTDIARNGKRSLSGLYRDELDEVLQARGPDARARFCAFLQRNPRALSAFDEDFTARIARRIAVELPPLFDDGVSHGTRRAPSVIALAGTLIASALFGYALVRAQTQPSVPVAPFATASTTPIPQLPAGRSGRRVPKSPALPSHAGPRASVRAISTPVPGWPAFPTFARRSQPRARAANAAKIESAAQVITVTATPRPATSSAPALDVESGTPIWRRGAAVTVQATSAPAPTEEPAYVAPGAVDVRSPAPTASPTPQPKKAWLKRAASHLNPFKPYAPAPAPSGTRGP